MATFVMPCKTPDNIMAFSCWRIKKSIIILGCVFSMLGYMILSALHISLAQGEFVRNINRALASGVQELEAPPLRHADIPDASSSRMTTHDHAMFLGSHCATREAR